MTNGSLSKMAGSSAGKLSSEQRLRAMFEQDVRALAQECAQSFDLDLHQNSLSVLGELAWRRLRTYAADLEQFAKHAKRSSVNTEDVKLLVRRNPSLKLHISQYAETVLAASTSKKRRAINSAAAENPTANNKTKQIEISKPPMSSNEVVDTTIDLT